MLIKLYYLLKKLRFNRTAYQRTVRTFDSQAVVRRQTSQHVMCGILSV